MPLTTYTGLTELEHVIKDREISSFVQGFERPVTIGQAITWARIGKGSVPISFPRWNALSAAPAVKAETEEFTDVNIDGDEELLTPQIVGFRLAFSDEGQASAEIAVPAAVLVEAMAELDNLIDQDVFAPAAAATEIAGDVTRDYTLDEVRLDVRQWKAMHVRRGPMGVICVIDGTPSYELTASLGNASATFAKESSDTLRMGTEQGYIGEWGGVSFYESHNLPADSTGHAGIMTAGGFRASALGLVMNARPVFETSRGDDGVNRATSYVVVSAYYATGLTNPNRALRIRTK